MNFFLFFIFLYRLVSIRCKKRDRPGFVKNGDTPSFVKKGTDLNFNASLKLVKTRSVPAGIPLSGSC